MRSRIHYLLIALLGVTLLSGCYRVSGDFTIDKQGNVKMEFTSALPGKLPVQKMAGTSNTFPQAESFETAQVDPKTKKYTFSGTFKEAATILANSPVELTELEKGGYRISTEGNAAELAGQANVPDKFMVPPKWDFKVQFPYEITAASDGVEVNGNVAIITQADLIGDPVFIEAAKPREVQLADPPSYDIPEAIHRNPWPARVFMGLICLGLLLATVGRFVEFPSIGRKR